MCRPDNKKSDSALDETALASERIERLAQFARVMRKESQRLRDRAGFLTQHADHLEKQAARLRRAEPQLADEPVTEPSAEHDALADELRLVGAPDRSSPQKDSEIKHGRAA